MNLLNASSASAISHWKAQKILLLGKLKKEQIPNSNSVGRNNFFENLGKSNFFNGLSSSMDKSMNKYRLFIQSIIKD